VSGIKCDLSYKDFNLLIQTIKVIRIKNNSFKWKVYLVFKIIFKNIKKLILYKYHKAMIHLNNLMRNQVIIDQFMDLRAKNKL
jgi:hypothetical protein